VDAELVECGRLPDLMTAGNVESASLGEFLDRGWV
jgi:hypothetical protein